MKSFATSYSFPVLGVLIIDKKEKKYRLNVGSDTSFSVALSRCLTEVYQGISNDFEMNDIMIDIPEKMEDFFLKDDIESIRCQRHEYEKYTQNATGQYPASLFYEVPSFDFDPACFEIQHSFEKENETIINKLNDLGFNVYIRNVSFLGFNSYWIYSSGMSILGNFHNDSLPLNCIDSIIDSDRIEEFLFDIENLKRNEISELINLLESRNSDGTMYGIYRVETVSEIKWGDIPVSYLLAILYLYMGNKDKAKTHFFTFSEIQDSSNSASLNLLKSIFVDGNNEKSDLNNNNFKNLFYQTTRSSKYFLNLMRFPKCPECKICDLSDDCLTKNKVNLYQKIATHMKEQKVNQEFEFVRQ